MQANSVDAAADAVRAAILASVSLQVRDALAALQKSQSKQTGGTRLVLLLLQPHIDPGTKADQYASFSLEIQPTIGDVNVLYLHPTRTYDLSDQTMLDVEQSTISLAARSKTPDLDVAVDADRRARREARARYLSRVNKTSSFAERTMNGTMKLGWNFYPSNVVVKPTVWGGYEAKGYLEPGGRDCAVWLLVPQNATDITFKMKSSYGDIDGKRHAEIDGGTYKVQLPSWTPLEGITVVGEAPMFRRDPIAGILNSGSSLTRPAFVLPQAE
jgi:hypothetical protein